MGNLIERVILFLILRYGKGLTASTVIAFALLCGFVQQDRLLLIVTTRQGRLDQAKIMHLRLVGLLELELAIHVN